MFGISIVKIRDYPSERQIGWAVIRNSVSANPCILPVLARTGTPISVAKGN